MTRTVRFTVGACRILVLAAFVLAAPPSQAYIELQLDEPPQKAADLLGLTDAGSAARTAPATSPPPIGSAAGLPARMPTWSTSFVRDGVSFPLTLIGGNPRRGGTTSIATLLVPVRFEFDPRLGPAFGIPTVYDAGTDLVDGQVTAIQSILASPLFTSTPFKVAGVDVGTTQYLDAYLRANFWDQVQGHRDWHTRLQPFVAPTVTMVIPLSATYLTRNPATGTVRFAVDRTLFAANVEATLASWGLPASVLPAFITGPVATILNGTRFLPGEDIAPTWIMAWYPLPDEAGGAEAPDVLALSHEILEHVADPGSVNPTPGWKLGTAATDWCYSSFFEVADPVQAPVPVAAGGRDWHLNDGVFVDYYSHRRSRSAGGAYSFFGLAAGPSAPCIGDTVYPMSWFNVPGASSTSPTGINEAGDMVGTYWDPAGNEHSFLWRRQGRMSEFTLPGALQAVPWGINRSGDVSGWFFDGAYHGFVLGRRGLVQIDVPGATDTLAFHLAADGSVGGDFFDVDGNCHGFVWRRGRFEQVDVPGAVCTAVMGVNSHGDLAIATFDADGNWASAWTRSSVGLRPVALPPGVSISNAYAIDDQGRLVGNLLSPAYGVFGFWDGFVAWPDGRVEVLATRWIQGMDNELQVVGVSTSAFTASLADLRP